MYRIGFFGNLQLAQSCKVGCVLPMVISSEFRIGQCKEDDHRKDTPVTPHFTCRHKMSSNKRCNPRPDFSTFRWLNLSFLGIDQYLLDDRLVLHDLEVLYLAFARLPIENFLVNHIRRKHSPKYSVK